MKNRKCDTKCMFIEKSLDCVDDINEINYYLKRYRLLHGINVTKITSYVLMPCMLGCTMVAYGLLYGTDFKYNYVDDYYNVCYVDEDGEKTVLYTTKYEALPKLSKDEDLKIEYSYSTKKEIPTDSKLNIAAGGFLGAIIGAGAGRVISYGNNASKECNYYSDKIKALKKKKRTSAFKK